MTRSRAMTFVGCCALLAWQAACADDERPEEITHPGISTLAKPDSGSLTVVLDAAPGDLGAAVVAMSGKGIGGFTAAAREQTGSTAVGDTVWLVLRGDLTPGVLGQVAVADRRVPPTVTVLDAAARKSGGYRALDPSSVRVRLARP